MMPGFKLTKDMLWLGLIPLSLWFISHYQFAWNKTNSLPQKLFVIKTGALPAKNDYVLFYAPPTSTLKQADTIIKKVIGVCGNIVTKEEQVFYIDGKKIAVAKTHSLKGRPLQTSTVGMIPKGKYFVWTPHIDSYDSRYDEIGLIDERTIIGVAYPLF